MPRRRASCNMQRKKKNHPVPLGAEMHVWVLSKWGVFSCETFIGGPPHPPLGPPRTDVVSAASSSCCRCCCLHALVPLIRKKSPSFSHLSFRCVGCVWTLRRTHTAPSARLAPFPQPRLPPPPPPPAPWLLLHIKGNASTEQKGGTVLAEKAAAHYKSRQVRSYATHTEESCRKRCETHVALRRGV